MIVPSSWWTFRRKMINRCAIGLATLITLLGLLLPFWILFTVVNRGLGAFNWALLTQMTPPPEAEGGLYNAIIGSFIMVGAAALIASPIGVITGIYLAEYGRKAKPAMVIRFVNDILLSAPSIVIGVFVYMIMVVPFRHFSGWAGIVALAVIALPIIVRTTENMLLLVPDILREGGLALGSSRRQVIMKICVPAARNGIITGILLSVARISGETAPLLFTALNNQFYSHDLSQPMANLPVVIFQYAMSPYENWQRLAWAGAALITVYVVAINILARTVFAGRR
ncbi:phosphate ABC transporter membrane protein 2 (PhoT family) [Fluviicoccus keumensis]|uniref:Phosphate transport system permease protein PstA n=1 Tax=Fluviicoccus keumensis TaxID=1435465 RepID=A0A4Q7Z5J5_9GAMM|nr:phosphate ABC transporter permease PstA [Fluviicoccus keumensis]RZU45111.1 phosphate ABC transporter membrane protein 2 (PhoT family) [Fluviicoccus keumensis]